MERFFQILAVILAGVAAYFLIWQGNADRAFVSAVFGAVSFFLSVRFQVKARLNQREAERLEAERRKEEVEIEEETTDSETPKLNEIPAREEIGNEQRTTNNEPKL